MPSSPPSPRGFVWRKGSDLAKAVRTTRERMELTQTQLAKRASVSRMFLYQLESGKDSLRADKVMAVLAAVGLRASIVPGIRARAKF
jgi:transcriptional regulator with XRE-family HTH domain